MRALRILISGVVQGVGFRPFVFRLARKYGLKGWVRNTGEGVEIAAWGKELSSFLTALEKEAPPLARITSMKVFPLEGQSPQEFSVAESQPGPRQTYIPFDVATCEACLAEIFDPADRRYGYPFTNCTNCGPRYSVILDLPYDREKTTMAPFKLCPDCLQEYLNPEDRRFHAEPNACPRCGPRLWVVDSQGRSLAVDNPLDFVARRLFEGAIVALKGLGGFQLAVSAQDEAAVIKLRARKHRPAKPLAIMVRDLSRVKKVACLDPGEEEVLVSPRRPIVLLKKKDPFPLAPSLAPGIDLIGVMLPYTPLHHLLLKKGPAYLVMTSGNLSDEPIARTNEEALERLASIADFFLLHDREIAVRVDDSVVRVMAGRPRLIRRARGYVPEPFRLPGPMTSTLATGAFLKNTFSLTREAEVFVSQHIGDLDSPQSLAFFEETLEHLLRLLDLSPRLVVSDLHPDYLSSQWARDYGRRKGIRVISVQHHLAHALATLTERGLSLPSLAVVLDGLGLGLDGAIWGGEVFWLEDRGFQRLAHLEYLPLPGGEAAIKSPWRMATSALYTAMGPEARDLPLRLFEVVTPQKWHFLTTMMEKGINSPPTSSAGRLFDAVAALLGLCYENLYEAQAAMMLEALAVSQSRPYPFSLEKAGLPWRICLHPAIRDLVADILAGVPSEVIAGRFVATLAEAFSVVAAEFARRRGVRQILLSGGCFQNRLLLEKTLLRLESLGLIPYAPENIPVNDGGISLGQAAYVYYYASS